jgi:hypothetical protein
MNKSTTMRKKRATRCPLFQLNVTRPYAKRLIIQRP